MIWVALAFMSAALLGCYDFFKKISLKENAVIPVLFLNTLFSALIFLPFILLSRTGVIDVGMLHVPEDGNHSGSFRTCWCPPDRHSPIHPAAHA